MIRLLHALIFLLTDQTITLGNSDDGSTGIIVGAVVGGIMGIISVAVIVILSVILWHHCKRHKEENTPGSYCVCIYIYIYIHTHICISIPMSG